MTQLTELLDALTNELQDYQWLPAEPITGGGAGGAGGGPTLQLRPYQVQVRFAGFGAKSESELVLCHQNVNIIYTVLPRNADWNGA